MDEREPQVEWERATLPADVVAAREEAERTCAGVAAVSQPRIAAHLAALTMALDDLARRHQYVVEATDLDLDGETLALALWEVSTRSIGLSRALIALLHAGFGPETVPTRRAMHEANLLLRVLQDSDEDKWRRRYFAGKDVKPGQLRKSDQAIAAASDEANPDLDPVAARVGELTARIYGSLSQGGHNRRPSIRESIMVATRTASTGPHPNPFVRAHYVAESNPAIEETVIAVGGALRRFYRTSVWTDHVKVTQRTLEAIRADQPLDEGRLLYDAKI